MRMWRPGVINVIIESCEGATKLIIIHVVTASGPMRKNLGMGSVS